MAVIPLVQALGSGVVRLEPQITRGYTRVFISFPPEYDNESGAEIIKAKTINFWVTDKDCLALSDALRYAGDPLVQQLMVNSPNG